MKKSTLTLLFCLAALALQAQKEPAVVVEDNFQRLQVSFSTGDIQLGKTEMNGQTFTQLIVEGMQPSAQVGAPELPTWSALVETPLCSGFEVEVSGVEYDTIILQGAPVAPLQPSRSKSDQGPHTLTIDETIYNTNAFFAAAALATVEPVGMARDRQLARLQFSPVSYNPVRGLVVICRKATVTVHYTGADEAASLAMFEKYHSPAFSFGQATFNNLYPKAVRTGAPVRYLIVAHSMFRGQLDSFVDWKRRKGFITDIVYTDEAAVGTTSTNIAAYVKSQYDNATAARPAPTYLLLVGDHEQIPAFAAQVTSPDNDHITDLYYACWTSGDHIPDCYMGRFSAQNLAQLTPQIEKTLMYEQYTFADPTFLDRAVMVAGVDGGSSGDFGYTHADPAMDYAITNYVNGAHGFSQVKYFKNNTSIVPTGSNVTMGSSASSNSATVRNCYNEGAGWINYSAHGSATSWGTPNFTTSHAAAMTNSQKFGIMIGNCCLTNKFETETCLGESVLRKGNYCGAVGYIGGSNSTYWSEDFYWAVGIRSGIGPTMSMAYDGSRLGAYDRIFHTHGEAQTEWVATQGSIVMMGNMAVENSSSSLKYYYWEIYHLMGDPSLMPYLTQASQMTLTASSVVVLGAGSLSVSAAPYAYVALTDTLTRTLWAAAYADASGNATLTLPSGMLVGGYELAASAQQYRTAFQPISVVPASGPYPMVVGVTPTSPLDAGTTVPLHIAVANLGNSNANGITVTLNSDNPMVTLSSSSLSIGSLPAGDTVYITSVNATADAAAADATHTTVTATTQWTGSTAAATYNASLTVNAPLVAMTVVPSANSLLPEGDMTVTVEMTNNGHATLASSQVTLTSGNPLLTVTSTGGSFTLAPSATLSRQFQLHAAANIDTNIFVPIYVHLDGGQTLDDTLQLFIGRNTTETFEGGQFALSGWVQGDYPWTPTSDQAYEGSWSAHSASNLEHNNTSEMLIAFTAATADSVSFYYKVSSESNYDKFFFHLDGVEKLVASGEVNWTRAVFAVAAGAHELTFNYTKDYSVSNGSDCAWVDNVVLPHGSALGGGGETPDDGTYEDLTATFESASYDSRWTLVGGDLTNVWTIGTAAANNSNRGLYVSSNGGATNEYNGSNPSSVFAYTTVWLEEGDYTTSFDWRCNGESSYDYLRAALLRNTGSLTAASTAAAGWSTTGLPTNAIAIDGGEKLNLSSTWQTKTSSVHINARGWYRLVFYWRNDNSVSNNPPAAIDNVVLTRVVEYRTLTVSASHGVATGSGDYELGQTATVGVYPEAGYAFVGWNDGNVDNPRQVVVDANRTLTATLSLGGGTIIQHDTTYVNVPVHDTTVIVETLTMHDTTVVTLTDTVTLTQTITLTDTVTLTEYVPVHDTTVVVDTVTLTEYIQVYDTTIVTDTVTLTEYVPVHDTTVVVDTVTLTEYIQVHDTTIVFADTVTLTEYIQVHDTTVVYADTVTLIDTVTLTDTIMLTEYVPVHDTTVVTLTDTVTLTEYVPVHDTTIVTQTDTVTLTEYVPIHDTTVVTLTDTITLTEYVPVHDTTVVTLTDTVTLTEYVPVHDTTVVTLTDTVTLTEYVPVHDTTVVTLTDTVTLTEYVPVHDTSYVTDTLWMTDTIYIYDTVYIHDTVYVPQEGIGDAELLNLKVYARSGQVVVEGANGREVTLYDVTGRALATRRDEQAPLSFDVPASGTYLIKAGDYPARRIVVIR